MTIRVATMGLTVVVGMLLVIQGCSKKSIQSGGDAQSSDRGMAKSGHGIHRARADDGRRWDQPGRWGRADSTLRAPRSRICHCRSRPQEPELAVCADSIRVAGAKPPSEERLGGGGTMLAKVEPSESTRDRSKIFAESRPRTSSLGRGRIERCVFRLRQLDHLLKRHGNR